MKKIQFLLLLLLLSFNLIGRTTRTSVADGSWSTSGNWSPSSVPATNQTNGQDDIVINSNITLTGDLYLKSGTTLTITGCHTLTINGNVTFSNGSTLIINTCSIIIINGNVTNNNNSNDISINGTIQISGNYDGGNGSAIIGSGEMEIAGTVTTVGTGTVFTSEVDCTSDCNNSSDDPLSNGLPIELILFEVSALENFNLIEWTTASEVNNEYFILEKSLSGMDFASIGRLSGAGWSSSNINYSILDTNPTAGISYYRLIQNDFDGNFEISDMISISRASLEESKIIYITDIFGRIVGENYEGIMIIYFDNGTIIKKIKI